MAGWSARTIDATYRVSLAEAKSYFFEYDGDKNYLKHLYDEQNISQRKVTNWKAKSRTLTYTFPIDGYPVGPKSSNGIETQTIIRSDKTTFVCECRSVTPDVPYGKHFVTVATYSIRQVGRDATRVTVDVKVELNGAFWAAPFINWATKRGLSDFYARAEKVIQSKLGSPMDVPPSLQQCGEEEDIILVSRRAVGENEFKWAGVKTLQLVAVCIFILSVAQLLVLRVKVRQLQQDVLDLTRQYSASSTWWSSPTSKACFAT